MNKFLITLFFTFISLLSLSQGINCNTSDPFCTGTTYTFPNATGVPSIGAIDCLGSTPNPAWYYMELDASGNMTIQIEQTNTAGSGIDVDFALFGPYPSLAAACATIPGGPVEDCSYSTAAIEYADISGGITGEVYVLLLTNFSGQVGTIEFSQTNGIASADCSILCGITGFTANASTCDLITGQYSVSGTLSIASPPTSGTLTISNSCGGSQIFNAPFSSSINYNFAGLSGGSGCTVSATFSADPLCNSTVGYTAPTCCNLSASITTVNVLCFGDNTGSATANPSGGIGTYDYSWNTVPTQITQTATGLFAGTYNCTITDDIGCQIIVSATVTEPTQLNLNLISQVDASCFGSTDGSFTVAASGGVGPNYLYSVNSGPNQLSPVFNSLIAGNYNVLVTDQNGCQQSLVVVINQSSTLNSSFAVTNTTCDGLCDGQIALNVSGGTAPYTYLWSDGQVTNSAIGLCAGNYSVVISDDNGCQFNLSGISIGSPNALLVNPTTSISPICIGQNATLIDNTMGGTSPYTYLWSNGAITPITNVSPVVSTTYFLTVTDNNGCVANGSVLVDVHPPLNVAASATPSIICLGDNSTLDVIVSGGNGGPYSYSWSNGSLSQTTIVSPNSLTNYTVTITDGCSSPTTDNIVVDVVIPPVVSYTTTSLMGCEPLTVDFTNNTPGVASCTWIIDGISYNSCNVTHTFNTQGTYNAQLFVDYNGCIASSSIINAIVFPNPIASFTVNPTIVSIITPIVYTQNMSSTGLYQWDFGDGSTYTSIEPQHTYSDTGEYTIQLIVTTQNGCVDTTWATISVDESFSIYVPNSFTPDGDNKNDSFVPVVMGVERYDFWIFNRWGEIIYYSDSGRPWDATHKNTKVKEDVYVWKVIAIDLHNKKHEFVGHVTVLK